MIPRCFILFGIFALFCAIAVITAEEGTQEGGEGGKGKGGKGEEGGKGGEGEIAEGGDSDEARAGWPAFIAKAFGSLFAGAAAGCFGEAFSKCKGQGSLGGALRCGRDFLRDNKGRCATG